MIKRYSDVIILTIIGLVSVYSIIIVVFRSYEIGLQNYIGYGMFGGITILRLLKLKKIKTLLAILLIIGSTNAIQFTYSSFTFLFELSWSAFDGASISLGLQPLSAILLIFLIIVHRTYIIGLVEDLLHEDPKIAEMKQRMVADKHYNDLKTAKESTLKEIIDNRSMYQVEYVKAAIKVFEERKINKTEFNDQT